MRTRLLAGLAIASIGLVSACASTPNAAPTPTTPPVTETSASPTTVPTVPMPPLPKVAAAKETIVKETPPPPAGVPCDAGVDACIDLSANKSWLISDGEVAYGPVPITHGRSGWETPPGTFQVGWKNIDHKSSLFDGAPMPFSVFFNGGIAFHEGSLSELSHGCIHLSHPAAKKYFNALSVGDTVQVVR
ncbi:L,D-transpeptidase [Actinophytocola glycyrrhizae]|uniref:L,D-transpeptidase n=1 Tax=Actinophytocola glycyrrhizae TaxID=2044873 RepID=A0ABV9S114_9PSEU